MNEDKLEKMAIEALSNAGITVDYLVEQEEKALLKIKLLTDMGMLEIPSLANATGEASLADVARAWMDEASRWPYQDDVLGISTQGCLLNAAVTAFKNQITNPMHQLGFRWNDMMAMATCQSYMTSLQMMPDRFHVSPFLEQAFALNGDQIKMIEPSKMTNEFITIAVTTSPLAIKHVPKALRTDEHLDMCVRQSGGALVYLDGEGEKTPSRITMAIETAPWVIAIVNEDMLTRANIERAVSLDGTVLDQVPDKFMNSKVCKLAIRQNPVALALVPEPLLDQSLFRMVRKLYPDVAQEDWFQDIEGSVRGVDSERYEP